MANGQYKHLFDREKELTPAEKILKEFLKKEWDYHLILPGPGLDSIDKTITTIFGKCTTEQDMTKQIIFYFDEGRKSQRSKHQQPTNLNDVEAKIHHLMLQQRREHAIELAANHLLQTEHIHTTRHDENPEIWVYREGIYVSNGRTHLKERIKGLFGPAYTAQIANNTIAKIEVQTYIEPKQLFEEEEKELIPVQNGILNIKTRKLSPFTPQKKFFNKLPVNYRPEADCPNIKKFIRSVVKHNTDVTLIQELFGWCLIRDYTYEKSIMLTGGGRNGKGKTVEIFKQFLGPENCVNIPLQAFQDQYSAGELHRKLANIGADIGKEYFRETGMFKQLTGRDLISADRKYKNKISFVNYAKMIFCANEIPQSGDDSLAFYQRWIIIEYPWFFLPKEEIDPKDPTHKLQDPHKIEKVLNQEELDGLLNWALEGLERLRRQDSFSHSKSTEAVKNLWKRKASSFFAFCDDNVVGDWDSSIEKAELRREYVLYCRNHKMAPVGDKAIKNLLEREYGVMEERVDRGAGLKRYWRGVAFCQANQANHGFSKSLGKINSLGFYENSSLPGEPGRSPSNPRIQNGIFTQKDVLRTLDQLGGKAETTTLETLYPGEPVDEWLSGLKNDGDIMESPPGTIIKL